VKHGLGIMAACAALASFGLPALAASLTDAEAVAHLDASGKDGYREFLDARVHRAFVIAPGGAWAWKADGVTATSATQDALRTCQQQAGPFCVPYAIDDRVVFDARKWATLWGPYQTRAEAGQAKMGQERGSRFFDLAFKSPTGKLMKISDFRGKVVVLHFWASWCPPCRREMPQLQKLHQQLGAASDVQLVLLQVRESFATAKRFQTAASHWIFPPPTSSTSTAW